MTAQYAQYLTWIANIDYRWHPKWNTYVKGTYETGSIYKDNRIYEKGTYRKTWNVQLCVEYYPLKRKDLQIFLHLSHKKQHSRKGPNKLEEKTSRHNKSCLECFIRFLSSERTTSIILFPNLDLSCFCLFSRKWHIYR